MKPALSFESFYEQYVTDLRRGYGDEMQGLCPFHEDSRPSFSVNVATGLWYCHRCAEGGNARQFARRLDIPMKEVPRD